MGWHFFFDENGVCGACKNADLKNRIDWKLREKELIELCNLHRSKDGSFDCIVPASGGKDSARVAHELKYNYGMHPLTITYAPFEYTPEGYKNFRDFIKVGGFNNLMCWQNGKFHRKLSRLCFEALGDAWQAFTFGQVCYAFHIALRFGIKLIFFGENGEAEYSGDPRVFDLRGMPVDIWSEQYFKGVTVEDVIQSFTATWGSPSRAASQGRTPASAIQPADPPTPPPCWPVLPGSACSSTRSCVPDPGRLRPVRGRRGPLRRPHRPVRHAQHPARRPPGRRTWPGGHPPHRRLDPRANPRDNSNQRI